MTTQENDSNIMEEQHEDGELTDEMLNELALQAQEEALRNPKKPKRYPFPKWTVWLMAIVLTFSTFSVIFEIYSIPAIEFLKTSTALSKDPIVQQQKESVVLVRTEDGKGTGFIISEDGYILTNHHVIEDQRNLFVSLATDDYYDATLIASYPEIDTAILKINAENLPTLTLAERYELTADEPIHFIGNPLSFTGIVNQGEMIDYTKLASWDELVLMIQAPVYRGNSGSPVFNKQEEVIGIVFATLKDEHHGKVGLVIPIELVQEKLSQLNE